MQFLSPTNDVLETKFRTNTRIFDVLKLILWHFSHFCLIKKCVCVEERWGGGGINKNKYVTYDTILVLVHKFLHHFMLKFVMSVMWKGLIVTFLSLVGQFLAHKR